MDSQKFKNLYNFFNYLEFCPLCGSRMIETSTCSTSMSEVKSKELVIQDFQLSWKKITVNLLDNKIDSNYINEDDMHIVIGRQCAKYHFFYNGTAILSKERNLVENIILDKYHFIRIHGPTHFTVNGSLEKSSTSIRITTPDFKTRELILPFINFDLTSKKKIDNKLKHIQLLS